MFPICNQFFKIHHCTVWGNQKPQLSGKRVTVEQNGVKFGPQGGVFSVHRVLLTLQCLRSFWAHSVHFNFPQACISKTAGRRAKRSEIWASGMSIQCTGIRDTCEGNLLQVILGVSVFPIFKNLVPRKRQV